MVISHKYRFIFIKNLKIAGTSLEAYLSPLCGERDIFTPIYPAVAGHQARNYGDFYNHMPAHDIRSRVTERLWESYFRFTIERNPWDKTLSFYHMMKRRHRAGLSFDQFFIRHRPPVTHSLYTDPVDGSLLVDRVLRYEHLRDDLGEVFDSLGVPFEDGLNIYAKSGFRDQRKPYQECYTDDQRLQVERAFEWEIKHFDYRF